ncbi:MAG: Spy/CpxP family protein refolding chaperone [Rhodospirillaceae bacterium]|jgi:hypothetical protein|nr:Spy/CpxP family protein refolding chaperone [Rhodospirillaceae bacterium]MBT3928513.1 Spy/CpxP family protein refolding chaperone [Rhodospirillaceae bacterium]MBT4426763.1 Spy/CpxP family protein refolding chaperone [Rhodospirillaceae bacterium]MBT5676105.1 Spy/CpxP family protein refolding chaperone [Rhodospirillaceae bacterium]MBT7293826.1 Spy/CpxP family protein refolding chaperone [Rhodospirillaceae bacterium]
MRRRGILIGSGVAALALALSLVGLRVSQHPAWAHGQSANHGSMWSGHAARHGGGHMSGIGHFCSAKEGAQFDKLAAYFKPELDLTKDQEAAWSEFAAAWRKSEADFRQSCDADEDSSEAIGALFARAESQLDAGLGAVRKLRPAFERFHATLGPEQKRILNSLGHR